MAKLIKVQSLSPAISIIWRSLIVIEDNTLYITGAGVSAESGIPTFRGTDGLRTAVQKFTTEVAG